MSAILAAALMLVLCSAAASLILLLPAIVAAESLHNAPPRTARRFWLIVSALPLVAGTVATTAAFVLLSEGPLSDPHHVEIRGRPHLCLLALTKLPDASFRFRLYGLIALGLVLFALGRLIWGTISSERAQRLAHRLVAASGGADALTAASGPPVITLDLEEPDCFSLGLDEPVVVTTTGLARALEGPEHAAVLAHERCHVRHHDLLAELGLRAVSDLLIFLPTTHFYQRAARAAMERVCDEAAAGQVSAEALAAALRKLALLKQARQLQLQGDLAPLRPTFAAYTNPRARLAALADERLDSLALPLPVAIAVEAVVLLAAMVWLAGPLHDTLYCMANSLLAVMRQ